MINGPAISLYLFLIAWAGIFTKITDFKGWKTSRSTNPILAPSYFLHYAQPICI